MADNTMHPQQDSGYSSCIGSIIDRNERLQERLNDFEPNREERIITDESRNIRIIEIIDDEDDEGAEFKIVTDLDINDGGLAELCLDLLPPHEDALSGDHTNSSFFLNKGPNFPFFGAVTSFPTPVPFLVPYPPFDSFFLHPYSHRLQSTETQRSKKFTYLDPQNHFYFKEYVDAGSQSANFLRSIPVHHMTAFKDLWRNVILPHRWDLFYDENIVRMEDTKLFFDNAKIRFNCSSCRNGWTSMRGRVCFLVEFHQSHGSVSYYPFKQKCAKCLKRCSNSKRLVKFEEPGWYPEEIQKVVENLLEVIVYLHYGGSYPRRKRFLTRPGRPSSNHEPSSCQACHIQKCRFL